MFLVSTIICSIPQQFRTSANYFPGLLVSHISHNCCQVFFVCMLKIHTYTYIYRVWHFLFLLWYSDLFWPFCVRLCLYIDGGIEEYFATVTKFLFLLFMTMHLDNCFCVGGIQLPIFSEWWLAKEKFAVIDSFILSSFPGSTFQGCNGLSVKYQVKSVISLWVIQEDSPDDI